MPHVELAELEYLHQVELLANDLVNIAADEGWLSYEPEPEDAPPVQRAVNELARRLRHYHFEDDGCVDPELPLVPMAGALLITPQQQYGKVGTYADICARIGVEARPEGWALWHTWDQKNRPITIVASRIRTTEGMLVAWRDGRHMLPAKPERSAVAAVVRGWTGPMVLSPGFAAQVGIADGVPPAASKQ